MKYKLQEKKFLLCSMIKTKSLVDGIGNISKTKIYYDLWSNQYDMTLSKWNYQAPKKCANLLFKKVKNQPKYILDLACGTGLFGSELKKLYKDSYIYGSDISKKSLKIAKQKNIYYFLTQQNFEEKYIFRKKFDLVSIIGAMTYCNNFDKLFKNIKFYLSSDGYFIFSHRIDLWKSQKFDDILSKNLNYFKIKTVSRPCNYLPLNKYFQKKIKIKLVLLQKR